MAVSDNEIVVRDQKVAGSNPVTSTKSPLRIGYNLSEVFFYLKRLRNPATTGRLSLMLFGVGVKIRPGNAFFRPKSTFQATIALFHFTPYFLRYCTGTHFPTQEHTGKRNLASAPYVVNHSAPTEKLYLVI